jgi:hypothetical protein
MKEAYWSGKWSTENHNMSRSAVKDCRRGGHRSARERSGGRSGGGRRGSVAPILARHRGETPSLIKKRLRRRHR